LEQTTNQRFNMGALAKAAHPRGLLAVGLRVLYFQRYVRPMHTLRLGSERPRSSAEALRYVARIGDAEWSGPVARQAHYLMVTGSNPARVSKHTLRIAQLQSRTERAA